MSDPKTEEEKTLFIIPLYPDEEEFLEDDEIENDWLDEDNERFD